jgi:type I restriction enzyme M protein
MLGAVAPQGVLSRARDEGEIRRRMLQNDLVEAVITIPRHGLSPSSDPACLLILNKAKPRERRGNVLVVNGDQEPAPAGSGLSDGAVDRISSAFKAWEDRDGFCRIVSLEEIERNGYILTVARYVPTAGAGARADLASEWQILLRLIDERNEAERKLIEEMGRLEPESHDA